MTDTLYYQLATSLEDTRAMVTAAETHGVLCAMLCFSNQLDINSWLSIILDQSDYDPSSINSSPLYTCLIELQEDTESGFGEDSGSMTLLLPPDEEPLNERLEALACWCEGFLHGVGLNNHTEDPAMGNLSEIAQEFIYDVREISRLDPDSEDEQAEYFYMELMEYLRVGVLLFREETMPGAIIRNSTIATSH